MAKSKKTTSSDSTEATGSENGVEPASVSLEQADDNDEAMEVASGAASAGTVEPKKPTVTISEAALHDLLRQMQSVTGTLNTFSNEQAAWRQRMQQELAGQRTYVDSTVLKLQQSFDRLSTQVSRPRGML